MLPTINIQSRKSSKEDADDSVHIRAQGPYFTERAQNKLQLAAISRTSTHFKIIAGFLGNCHESDLVTIGTVLPTVAVHEINVTFKQVTESLLHATVNSNQLQKLLTAGDDTTLRTKLSQ